MRILHASAEVHPYSMTGGLASVASSLPSALHAAGRDVAVVTPLHDPARVPGMEWLEGSLRTRTGEEFGLGRTRLPGGCEVYFVASDEHFNRPGLYGPTDSEAYPDNPLRFAFFCRAVEAVSERLGDVGVIHCHDWHTGLVPVYCAIRGGPATVMTIHNLAFQGRFPAHQYGATGLPDGLFSMDGLEFHGDFSFLKGGILFADRITTVSPSYAAEIVSPEGGFGMEGVLASRGDSLTGILNGIDNDLWGPEDDPAIAAWYTAWNTRRKSLCREALVRECGLSTPPEVPIAGIVSRLTWQKGLDLVLPATEMMLADGSLNLVILGTGEPWIEGPLSSAAWRFPGRVHFRGGYDDAFSRRIYAGTDIFLMPSRFEPCGISQMIALRYGSVPVTRSTGGLADTVRDVSSGGYGFVFGPPETGALHRAVRRALLHFRDRSAWGVLRRRGMREDNSWARRVRDYEAVYAALEVR